MVHRGGQRLVELWDQSGEEEAAVGEARAHDGDQRLDTGPECERHKVDGGVRHGAGAPEGNAAHDSDNSEPIRVSFKVSTRLEI